MRANRTSNILPKEFIEQLKLIYPQTYSGILRTMEKTKPTTFRVNNIKTTQDEVINELRKDSILTKKGPIENSHITLKVQKIKISETEAFNNGKIYIQELSSMLPPLVLDPKEGDYILDMTASPGSKTTQMATLAKNNANILAIEKNKLRYQKLKHNIELQGAKVKTKLEDSIILIKKYPEFINFFDKILLDAPCSAEGRFDSKNSRTYKYWNLKKIKEMQSLQKRLISKAAQMLKPGGSLVYSTCTINTKENEEVVDWILSKDDKLKIEKIKLDMPNIKSGITTIGSRELNKDIKNTIRIIPNDLFSAFYIAKIRKENN